jgi:hypothetical protein
MADIEDSSHTPKEKKHKKKHKNVSENKQFFRSTDDRVIA